MNDNLNRLHIRGTSGNVLVLSATKIREATFDPERRALDFFPGWSPRPDPIALAYFKREEHEDLHIIRKHVCQNGSW